ncbi:hypothetical protein [Pseudanabaena sp. 'Roaring Creek']|uniref:hypothetical protein n=1 Tax=Pseudanabaena sp. 'Roaring Creek' TaxID=1681830 RepID=UPI000B33FC96|nr:hypothetical protein [Pseudanabaena sp. 'Roaring Creek']
MPLIMPLQNFSQAMAQMLFVIQLLFYSTMISVVIKYALPYWSLLSGLDVEVMNLLSLGLITLPVGLFAFVLWLKR